MSGHQHPHQNAHQHPHLDPHIDRAIDGVAHLLEEHPHVRSWTSRLLKLIPVAIVVGGITAASAATLGVSPDSVASGGITVSGCDSSVTVDYVTDYDATSGQYEVSAVSVSDIDDTACAGQAIDVVVASSDLTELSSASGTVSAAVATLTLAESVPAEDVAHVAVVITG